MQQYNAIKVKHPDALLLFRVGDFYETFGDDAVLASKILNIVLTKRANGSASHIALAGFPHHSLDTYLPKLVRAGQRVAVCDQLEDPKLTKKIVKRGVTELVTPGVTFNDQILSSKSNNFLASVYPDKNKAGIAFVDISTGEFLIAQGSTDYVGQLIQSFKPSEILISKNAKKEIEDLVSNSIFTFKQEDWVYQHDYCYELLTKQFETQKLKGFGIEDYHQAIIAAGSILHYLKETRHDKLDHVASISRIEEDQYVWMDKFTVRNLELFYSNNPDGVSLLDTINATASPMGSRLLKRWLALPLKNKEKINERLEKVQFFKDQTTFTDQLITTLSKINDLERMVSKLSAGRIVPREFNQLAFAIAAVNEIKLELSQTPHTLIQKTGQSLHDGTSLQTLISKYILDDPSGNPSKGGVIRDGLNAELDELRTLKKDGKSKLEEIRLREEKATGISSLKISFNNVFGYFLEVRNVHKDKVPEAWIRKQTLVNAERYITQELKEYESKILGAEEKISSLEIQLYQELIEKSLGYVSMLQVNATIIAELDCLSSFGLLALKHKYTKPTFVDDASLEVTEGRHPVIEQQLDPDSPYISNSVVLNQEDQQIVMITGPNMSGKSALLRQTALISIMAQMGSFVPADALKMNVLDKIFVRVGASDNISQGESTFMVEMNETASILNNLSENSLILLDEIGRGTSTYDGVSIAWAIAEFLHQHPTKPKTLFATHYHELNEMESRFNRIKNYNVSIKEMKNNIIFLRKLARGGSEHSFGIHVAKMAGMPGFVVRKAEKILKKLEESKEDDVSLSTGNDAQLSFFQLDDPLLEELKNDLLSTDINTLTPVEALMLLNELKQKLEK